MPTPNEGESEKEYMARCIPMMMDEGNEQDQAVAICMSKWREAKKAINTKSFNLQNRQWAIDRAFNAMFPPPPPPEPVMVSSMSERPWIIQYLDDAVIVSEKDKFYEAKYTPKGEDVEIASRAEWREVESKTEWVEKVKAAKSGARNNESDRGRIREVRKHAQAIHDITREMEPDDEDKPPMPHNVMKADIDAPLTLINLAETVTIKAAGDWELDILGVPFGGPDNGKDKDRQYFSPNTKLYQKPENQIPMFYYHGYEPDGRPQGDPELVGWAKYSKTDSMGHWFRGKLDKASKFAARVWEAAGRGVARASSGALAHIARYKPDGEITHWALGEISVFDAEGKRQPCNAYAVALPVAKANYLKAGIELPEITREGDQPEAGGDPAANPAVKTNSESANANNEVINMEKEDLIKLLDERDARKAAEAAEAAKAAELEQLRKENADLKDQAAKANRLPWRDQKGAPHTAEYSDTVKYDGLSTAEMGLLVDMQRNLAAKGAMPAPSAAAMKALMLKVMHIENDQSQDKGVTPQTVSYAKSALKAAFGQEPTDEAIKSTTADVNYTAGSSHLGEDWVGTSYSNQLWEKIRAAAVIASKIPAVTIPDGYPSQYWPLESTDPTWYKVAQTSETDDSLGVPAATVTKSNVATDDLSITVGKMGARVIYTQEMTEDSLINFVPQLRMQLEVSGAEQMEHVVIDGDTNTSNQTNINDIGGNTYNGNAATLFLLADGLRKVGIANGRSAAGGLSEDDYLDTVKKIGLNGIGADVARCGFIIDPNTYFKSLKLSTLKTKDVWTMATLENGVFNQIWGYPVFRSYFMHWRQTSRLANSAGKVDLTTPGNNLYGAILSVRWDQWKLAYKRRMTMETTRLARSDSWEIVALTRWGLKNRDAYAAAETYYVGV